MNFESKSIAFVLANQGYDVVRYLKINLYKVVREQQRKYLLKQAFDSNNQG